MDYCDICGRKCDGVHNNKKSNSKKEIEKIVTIIESHGEEIVDKVVERLLENKRLRENRKDFP